VARGVITVACAADRAPVDKRYRLPIGYVSLPCSSSSA